MTPTTKDLILIKVSTPSTSEHTAETVQAHITSAIEGQRVEFNDEELQKMTDWSKVKKIYKLNALGNTGGKKAVNGVGSAPQIDERKEFEVMILGSMALRGATN